MRIRDLAILPLLPLIALGAPLPDDPVAAWTEVTAAVNAPAPIIQLNGKLPSRTEMDVHRKAQSDAALHCAELAEAFVRKFPSHKQAGEARNICRERLNFAVRRGAHERLGDLERVDSGQEQPVTR
jgi:hypothetical protein